MSKAAFLGFIFVPNADRAVCFWWAPIVLALPSFVSSFICPHTLGIGICLAFDSMRSLLVELL